jgi:undecaprenyl diphosphate synthase
MLAHFKKWFQTMHSDVGIKSPISTENIPLHVAIIMDGNGRWAKTHGLPRVMGHRKGVGVIKKMATLANDLGIKYLTLYSFSTENWKRPKSEVDFLMSLPREFLAKEIDELIRENVKIQMIGFRDDLPPDTLKAVEEAELKTTNNSGLTLNFAFNYGSRREMIHAMQKMFHDVQSGRLKITDIDEQLYATYLFTQSIPDPDLLIRTSGELRISNFLMWQLAYTELWFTDTYWPDFTEHHFCEAIAEYQRRARRYGAL